MDDNQLDGLNQEQGVQESANPRVELTEDARAAARRRFLRGTLAAAPVLMTLKSKPVLACYCTSASAAMSGTLRTVAASNTPRQVACSGKSPGYWKVTNSLNWTTYKWGKYTTNNGSGLMIPVLSNNIQVANGTNVPTKFSAVFGGTKFGNRTFLQVLTSSWGSSPPSVTNSQLSLCRALVAGALNISSGRWPTTQVTLNVLKQIYLQIVEGPQYYLTSAGDKMYLDQAVDYLSNMWE